MPQKISKILEKCLLNKIGSKDVGYNFIIESATKRCTTFLEKSGL